MAAGIIGANTTLTSGGGSKSVNTILGGTNTYEKIIVSVVKTGTQEGAVHVGGSNVSGSIFGYIIRTGEEKEFYSGHGVTAAVNIGANLFFFNPSNDSLRIQILGFATA